MKEKLKNKKVVYTIIGIVSVLLVALAVTYAYWLVTKTQTGENEISSACLDISISGEKNDIELTNQFPMSDEDGMKLVPYEFTVTNNCNTSIDYQVALEATGESSNALKGTSLKVALNDSAKLYSAYPSVETTIEGAYESRVLGYSKLAGAGSEGSSDTYSLRIWIDADAPISEMSKTFKSRISVTIGQGIESGFEEGTLAYNILSNVGGAGVTSEIDAGVWDHETTATGDRYIYSSDNYYYGTEYTFDETTKKYTLSGTLTQAKTSECRSGAKTCGKYTLQNTSSTYSSTTLYEVTDFQSSGNYVTANTWGYVNAFGKVTDSTEAGLYKTQDDLGDSYYYRGAVRNNYVEFGTYSEDFIVTYYDYNLGKNNQDSVSKGDSMYWRIVRINGDGTIRLAYDGPIKFENNKIKSASIASSAYNTDFNGSKYVGYTYDDGNGNQVDSTIKGVIDRWYDTHLEENYDVYIADGIFCNDRTISNAEANGRTYYAAYQRIVVDKTPSLKCTNKSDRYTVDDTTNGNGLLSNPVGLLTVDEVAFAGLVETRFFNDQGINNYLHYNEYTWTMSPAYWDGNNYSPLFLHTDTIGPSDGVNHDNVRVRPVINLKADVKFTGDGSYETPYKIVTE